MVLAISEPLRSINDRLGGLNLLLGTVFSIILPFPKVRASARRAIRRGFRVKPLTNDWLLDCYQFGLDSYKRIMEEEDV